MRWDSAEVPDAANTVARSTTIRTLHAVFAPSQGLIRDRVSGDPGLGE